MNGQVYANFDKSYNRSSANASHVCDYECFLE